MARGITESDVHNAADELAANGERPTVERIRVHLGTGSPNIVTRWLETWWKNLGLRLQPKRPDLKDAPAALAELAGQWWALALQHARESVLEELAEAKQSLDGARQICRRSCSTGDRSSPPAGQRPTDQVGIYREAPCYNRAIACQCSECGPEGSYWGG